ncbi:Exostosin family protein [Trichomonas vaginalis G3]|uniref:Exostosin family protein n=1 Tax=Trichomonas vaginalis (strain ATCC PRA-98 / G3) TaxID=412133 RepID=A2EHA8_TRIV3|nr:macromolecule glycosylation [Trichomonas vaginalis G3]EAY07987.1 Exostosin family protein [Trichomonas vaginalis G3]KAI5486033.1 macromolecule glycosylation [Trichomonas vaginalis G3]|eukprot:XP_001320210.1 Exostosin family protein [Trichomonas vaginalis G3]
MHNLTLPMQELLLHNQYLKGIKQGLAHTTIFEYIAFKSLERYEFRVKDPEEADLFYVPLFAALFNGLKDYANIDTIIIPQLRAFGKYFDRYGGVDYAFIQMLFSQDNIPITVHQQKTLASMITLGDLNYNYSKYQMRESWRNVNFPLTSNIAQQFEIKPESSRHISTFFIGQINLTDFDTVAAPIREGMANVMRVIPHSIVIDARRYDPITGVYSYNFSRMMSNSKFCCVPHGDGPTTKRLFDTFRTLCIPIVLSDEIKFPFEDLFINYPEILIQIPAFEPDRIPIAMSIPSTKRKLSMKKNMIRVSHLLEQKFDYNIEKGNLMWGWLWVHYFKLSTVAASKRRTLLQSRYLD